MEWAAIAAIGFAASRTLASASKSEPGKYDRVLASVCLLFMIAFAAVTYGLDMHIQQKKLATSNSKFDSKFLQEINDWASKHP
jgi:hypothetical protein